MMRMRVGLHHVLNDPVGLIYTPVIVYFACILHNSGCRPVCALCWSIIIHVMMIYNLFQIVNTKLQQLYCDIVVLSRSLRKQDIFAQFIVRQQDSDG